MSTKKSSIFFFFLTGMLVIGCSKAPAPAVELKHYSLDSLEGLISRSNVALDHQVVSEGSSALRIEAAGPMTVRLFETGDIDVEDARVDYQARVRTRDVDGRVYLEMWCQFASKGEFFSRGLQSSLSGTADWATLQTPFLLRKGENPDNIKLNLVIEGKGIVWIDELRLSSAPRS